MTVSLVGRMAMGRSRSLCPALVTHATCTHTPGFAKQYNAVTQHSTHRIRYPYCNLQHTQTAELWQIPHAMSEMNGARASAVHLPQQQSPPRGPSQC